MRYFSIILLMLLAAPVALTQQKQGFKYIEDLCSPEFAGRGYTNNGDKKAAAYIAKLFDSFGVKSFKSDYYQRFKLSINTFPDKVQLAINGDTLQTGVDFIVDPSSGAAEGHYALLRITPENIESAAQIFASHAESIKRGELAILIDHKDVTNKDEMLDYYALKFEASKFAPVLWINNSKLTWGASREQRPYPIVEIADSVLGKVESIYLNIQPVFEKSYQTQNVIGYIPATTKKGRKRYKVVTAHYDHLGEMGSTAYIPGANDNASGTSMLLNLTAYYSEHPPKDYTVVFIAFGAEESGLVGSKYFTDHPYFDLKKITFLLNLDLLGTGEKGITVVNGSLHNDAFDLLVKINNENDYLNKIGKRGEAANSDHYHFTKNGVPAFFIYTRGGIKAYHDVYDRSETLPLTEYNDVFQLVLKFMDRI